VSVVVDDGLLAGLADAAPVPEELAGFDCAGTRTEVILLNDMIGSGRELHVRG
jgi:hypothetical protein